MDNNSQAVTVFNDLAAAYAEKYDNVGNYHESLASFAEKIEPLDGTMLELACGPGNMARYVFWSNRERLKMLLTDLAPNMLAIAQKNNPTAETMLLDCRNMRSLNRKFNAILCAFVLPYLNPEEVTALIADAAETLEDWGMIYLCTIEDEHSKSGLRQSSSHDVSLFTYYYEMDFLYDLLVANGFRVVDIHRIVNGKDLELVLIARKQKKIDPAYAEYYNDTYFNFGSNT